MQVSGFKATRHKKPSSHQPVFLPMKNNKESPTRMESTLNSTTYPGDITFQAAAAPAPARAMAAGIGSPTASRNTSAISAKYPWCSKMCSTFSIVPRLDSTLRPMAPELLHETPFQHLHP